MIRDAIKLMRPKHWIKNGFVVAPVIFSQRILDPAFSDILNTLIAVISFSLGASFIYVVNDIIDRDQDRRHPKKCKRPIASGRISVVQGAVLAGILLTISTTLAMICNGYLFAVVAGYIVMNLVYSLRLKHVAIIDILIISTGFLLRVIAGSVAIGVHTSDWILMTTFFISLFLGFLKRRNEMIVLEQKRGDHRKVLEFYDLEVLNGFVLIAAGLSIISYALYAISPETTLRFGASRMVFTIPFVVLGIFRYMMIAFFQGQGGDPVEVIVRDRTIIFTVFGWITLVIALMMAGQL